MTAVLLTENGARRVERHELAEVTVPSPTKTWMPVSHARIVDVVTGNLVQSGFSVAREEYALTKNDAQMFGVLDLQSEIAEGITLAVGIRNSLNKTLAAAMVAGDRCLVCSNLCFGGDIHIARKHTVNVEQDFSDRIETAILGLRQFQEASHARIEKLQHRFLTHREADALMLRAYEKRIVGTRLLPKLISEWRKPTYPAFEQRTAWSMLNAFTHVVKARQKTQPIQAARETIAFQSFLLSL